MKNLLILNLTLTMGEKSIYFKDVVNLEEIFQKYPNYHLFILVDDKFVEESKFNQEPTAIEIKNFTKDLPKQLLRLAKKYNLKVVTPTKALKWNKLAFSERELLKQVERVSGNNCRNEVNYLLKTYPESNIVFVIPVECQINVQKQVFFMNEQKRAIIDLLDP